MVLQITNDTRQIQTTLTAEQKKVLDRIIGKLTELAKEKSTNFTITGECEHPMFSFIDWIENSGEITGTEQEIARIFACGMNAGSQFEEKFRELLKIASVFKNLQDFIDKEKFSNELGD